MKPDLTPAEAERAAAQVYGLQAFAKTLPGELDANFRLEAPAGRRYVLKVFATARDALVLDFQAALLARLAAADGLGVATPEVCATPDGEAYGRVELGGRTHWVQLLSWVAGAPLRAVRDRSARLLRDWGALCGRLNRALAGFDHAGAHRDYRWDPRRAAGLPHAADLPGLTAPQRELYTRHRRRADCDALGELPDLPRQVCYADAHEDNLLVELTREVGPDGTRRARLAGLVDVGDAVYTYAVCELAIACAYAAMDLPDPVGATCALAAGCHAERPLSLPELEALPRLTVARLLTSVAEAARARVDDPANAYRSVSEQQAWEVLERLADVPLELWQLRLRAATLGLPDERPGWWAALGALATQSIIRPGGRRIAPLDLSVDSPTLGTHADYGVLDTFARRIRRALEDADAELGHGGYLETRPVYTTDGFAEAGNAGPRWRTVHLGLDLWGPAGEPVYAPLPGRVHSLADNDAPRDYGATLILEHELPAGDAGDAATVFYTLYGHLSRDSLVGKRVGQPVAAGELIAHTGEPYENGGWPPHLHVQVVADLLGREGDFPGVCFPDEVAVYRYLCPDPRTICGLPLAHEAAPPLLAADIQHVRRRHLGGSLSVSYARPLHIVRGAGAYLLDARGQRYLDGVNNVAHVGHEHPAVVAALQRQAAVLNTNTRYLHGGLTGFAERLLATLPDELCVVHLVNSGSEATELALRMARAMTGGRRGVVAVEGGYHGNTGGAVDVSHYKFGGPGGEGAPDYVALVPAPDAYAGRLRDAAATGEAYAAFLDAALAQLRKRGHAPAAFLCESVLSCGGQVVLPEGYLRAAYAKTRAAGGVCIADEVQTGLGRVGAPHWWASAASCPTSSPSASRSATGTPWRPS